MGPKKVSKFRARFDGDMDYGWIRFQRIVGKRAFGGKLYTEIRAVSILTPLLGFEKGLVSLYQDMDDGYGYSFRMRLRNRAEMIEKMENQKNKVLRDSMMLIFRRATVTWEDQVYYLLPDLMFNNLKSKLEFIPRSDFKQMGEYTKNQHRLQNRTHTYIFPLK
jgi:hypothetical protein